MLPIIFAAGGQANADSRSPAFDGFSR